MQSHWKYLFLTAPYVSAFFLNKSSNSFWSGSSWLVSAFWATCSPNPVRKAEHWSLSWQSLWKGHIEQLSFVVDTAEDSGYWWLFSATTVDDSGSWWLCSVTNAGNFDSGEDLSVTDMGSWGNSAECESSLVAKGGNSGSPQSAFFVDSTFFAREGKNLRAIADI